MKTPVGPPNNVSLYFAMVSRFAVPCFAVLALAVCGGGGSGALSIDPPSGSGSHTPATKGTASLHVNVASGQVTVTGLTPSRNATIAGSAVAFQSSTLLDEPGLGRKAMSVSITNLTNDTWIDSAGSQAGAVPLRLTFINFQVLDNTVDLRSLVNVATLSGTSSGLADGPVGSALFRNPSGVAVGSDGSIYIADTNNHKIRKIKKGVVSTVAGSGAPGGANGAGTAAQFNSRTGIAIGPDGVMVVTEFSGHRIRRVTPEGSVSTIAGTGTSGAADGTGNVATFKNPEGIAIDSFGQIYVADSLNHKIRRIVFNTGDPSLPQNYSVQSFAGSGVQGFAEGVGATAQFNSPRGLAFDILNNLYVTDRLNFRIRRITPNAEVTTIAGTGVAGAANGAGNVATFNQPNAIVTVGNSLVVADLGTRDLRQLTLSSGLAPAVAANWRVSLIAGAGTTGTTDGSGTTAQFAGVQGLAFNGNTLISADQLNHRLRTVTTTAGWPLPDQLGAPTSETVQLVNADGFVKGNLVGATTNTSLPYIDIPTGNLPPGASTVSSKWIFNVPAGVTAFDFVVDIDVETQTYTGLASVQNNAAPGPGSSENWIRTFTGQVARGVIDGPPNVAAFTSIAAFCRDSEGYMYVADGAAIRRVDPRGNVSTIAGSPIGLTGATDGIGPDARFNGPSGIGCTRDGKILFVGDRANQKVRRIERVGSGASPSDWVVSTVAGTTATTGDSVGSGSVALFRGPRDIVVVNDHTLYVLEDAGNRIRRIVQSGTAPSSPSNWTVSLFAGGPAAESGNVDNVSSGARFNFPVSMTMTPDGTLFVADANNRTIRKVETNAKVSTLAGGAATAVDGRGTNAGFATLGAMAADSAGNVYVFDNVRVRKITPSGAVSTVAGGLSIGNDFEGDGASTELFGNLGMATGSQGELYIGAAGTTINPSEIVTATTSTGVKIKVIERIIR